MNLYNKGVFLIFIIGFLSSTVCKSNVRFTGEDGNEEVDICIVSVDSLSIELYSIVEFNRCNNDNRALLLVEKSKLNNFYVGEKKLIELCDVKELKLKSIKDSAKDDTVGDIDTLTLRGHLLIDGKIYIDDTLLLDFSDDAEIPVFKVCD